MVIVAAWTLVAVTPAAATGPRLSATEAILWAPATDQRLYGVTPDRPVAVASATKLMTALVTLEHARLGTVFAAPNYHPGPSLAQIGLVRGERMSVHDLLLALLLPSAADAAEDLAYNVGHGSVSQFIAMMNASARRLGLAHTHYSTPIGVDTPGNHSSASDLVHLAARLVDGYPFVRRAVDARSAVLRSGNHARSVINRNDLIARYRWITGVKTGHTLDAGYVLVASARRQGLTLFSAVLGTTSEAARDADTLALLDYGYRTFIVAAPMHAGQILARLPVRDRPGEPAEVIAAAGYSRIVERTARVVTRVAVPRELSGPLPRQALVGSAVVVIDGQPVARVPLVLARALPAVSPWTAASHFISRPSTLIPLSALAALAVALTVRRTRSRHVAKEEAEPA